MTNDPPSPIGSMIRREGDVAHAKKVEGVDGIEGTIEAEVVRRTARLTAENDRLQAEIDEHRRAEHQQAALAQANRLSTMGEILAALAHELNQPLAAIANYARGCARRLAAGSVDRDELEDVVNRIADRAEVAGEIIHRIRRLLQPARPRRQALDVNDLVRELASLLASEARRRSIALRLELADDLPPVIADGVEVQQVLLNLTRNSFDAMENGPEPEGWVEFRTGPAGPGEVRVSVRDSGPGVPPDLLDHVFDPFVSTREASGQGRVGMGLAISRSIIESHGGRLGHVVGAGEGATFAFTLPSSGRSTDEEHR